MKRHFITIFTVLSVSTVYAQEGRVGINTTTPNATLDVTASPTDLTRTDGFIAPRLTGDQLKAKDSKYGNDQIGAIAYATSPVNIPITTKTKNITEEGYYYFNGTVWVRLVDKYQEPWNVIGSTNPATSNTQNIYQMGKVSIGKNAISRGANLSIYDATKTTNFSTIYTENAIDDTTIQWLTFMGNMTFGSYSSLTRTGDQAILFSVDNAGTSYSNNGLLIAPHTAAGSQSPFGLKITDQGMNGFNVSLPTETVDIGGYGTLRIRTLPYHGQTNAIHTTPAGGTDVPATSDINGLINKTQTFTGSRTVISDANGVLGYVDGLPVTKMLRELW